MDGVNAPLWNHVVCGIAACHDYKKGGGTKWPDTYGLLKGPIDKLTEGLSRLDYWLFPTFTGGVMCDPFSVANEHPEDEFVFTQWVRVYDDTGEKSLGIILVGASVRYSMEWMDILVGVELLFGPAALIARQPTPSQGHEDVVWHMPYCFDEYIGFYLADMYHMALSADYTL